MLRIEGILLFLEGAEVLNIIYIFFELLGVNEPRTSAPASFNVNPSVPIPFSSSFKAQFDRCYLLKVLAQLLPSEASE